MWLKLEIIGLVDFSEPCSAVPVFEDGRPIAVAANIEVETLMVSLFIAWIFS